MRQYSFGAVVLLYFFLINFWLRCWVFVAMRGPSLVA